jgi:hypothetical protein
MPVLPWRVLALLLLAGCGARPQYLGFNYQTLTFADQASADALVNRIRRGQTTVAAELRTPCNFTADFAPMPRPLHRVELLPPAAYEVVLIEAYRTSGPVPAIRTTNNPACPVLQSFRLEIGSAAT